MSALALLFIFAGQRFEWFGLLDTQLGRLATPFYRLTDIPGRALERSQDTLRSRSELLEENEELQSERLLLKAKVQKLASLEAENVRLRELLNSSALLDDSVLVAELIGLTPDPLRHEIIVNKGQDDDVYIGQPVIDALGLVGQVVAVFPKHSRVLLITDPTHALPVQINRNGVRSVAEGIGRYYEIELQHVAATTDIKVGDLLVSSGLGQRFPAGYPVAVVSEVIIDPGQPFAIVKATPSAALDRSRYVLLVFSQERPAPLNAEKPEGESDTKTNVTADEAPSPDQPGPNKAEESTP